MGILSHQVSLEHDVTQQAPTVTSQSERNRNVEKISTKPADSYPGTIFLRVNTSAIESSLIEKKNTKGTGYHKIT